MSEIEKMTLESESLVDDRLNKLKELMPEVFTESGIDFDKLRLEFGGEVDEGQERYAFTWPGKADAIRQSQTVSTATLRPCLEKSRSRDGEDGSFDSDNIYIEGDNLEVLKLLQRGYHGKVKMIYIDPPYNTGHDFVYRDSFGDTIENYKAQAGLGGQSNADMSGRYHSDWCSMMYPRLRLARELLTDDGVIFISIDDNEYANLKELCNEIFGENSFLATFVWKRRASSQLDKSKCSTDHEYVLAYKGSAFCAFRGVDKDYKGYSNPDNDPRGPWTTGDLTVGMTGDMRPNQYYDLVDPKTGIKYKPNYNRVWSYIPESMNQLIADNRIVFPSDPSKRPMKKRFLSELDSTTNPQSTWMDSVGMNTEGTKQMYDLFGKAFFTYTKPVSLVRSLILQATTRGDIVLDFFAGSSTTAHAVMQRNLEDGEGRRFILVQLPEILDASSEANKAGFDTICQIGEERIRRAGSKIKNELEESNRQLKLGEEPKQLPDIGFRVFTLDESGIERPEPGQLVLDVVKPDRTELDIVFEMMLKWGLELTLPVEKSDAAGYPIWSVACDELVCCMSRGLTIGALEAIANMEPRRVLILDSILDDTLKLNAVQIFKHTGERMGCEIELRTV